eukprot:CAMPEP_0182443082 /NCGR_PEP_ID=MMETSP1172-20130603/1916_1 /TAXON_ID=708627 /ORGANISM="Timspurckia oligopyrenoides, Strain CCMP3278" /LENGTH=838 /DNA_ID=CAMNT_0024638249 /DNA_START=58 /DNA_END=2574 /DNA_ORIENTATION=-
MSGKERVGLAQKERSRSSDARVRELGRGDLAHVVVSTEVLFRASQDVYCVYYTGNNESCTNGEIQLIRVFYTSVNNESSNDKHTVNPTSQQYSNGNPQEFSYVMLQWIPESLSSPSSSLSSLENSHSYHQQQRITRRNASHHSSPPSDCETLQKNLDEERLEILSARVSELLTIRRTQTMLRFTLLGSRIFLELKFGSSGPLSLLNALAPAYARLIPARDDADLLYVERIHRSIYDIPSALFDYFGHSIKPFKSEIQQRAQLLSKSAERQFGFPFLWGSSADSESETHQEPEQEHDTRNSAVASENLDKCSVVEGEEEADSYGPTSLLFEVGENLLKSDLGISLSTQLSRVTRSFSNVQKDLSGIISTFERNPSNIFDYQGFDTALEEELELIKREEEEKNASVSGNENQRQQKPRKACKASNSAVTQESWFGSCWSANGKLVDAGSMRYAIFRGGLLDSPARRVAWPFLLGVFEWQSTTRERKEKLELLRMTYSSLVNHWRDTFRKAFAYAATQKDAAKYETLFEVDFDNNTEFLDANSAVEACKDRGQRSGDDIELCDEGGSLLDLLEIRSRIEKDIVRTDRKLESFRGQENPRLAMMLRILATYALRNMSVGYCQGMSDLVTPLMMIFTSCGSMESDYSSVLFGFDAKRGDEEVMTFWCFNALMERVDANFQDDQAGIHTQLRHVAMIIQRADPELAEYFELADSQYYCCFRWILLQFKREFDIEDVSRLWEILWLDYFAESNLHIYITAALLIHRRSEILKLPRKFDSILRFVNNMSNQLDVIEAIDLGVRLYGRVGDKLSDTFSNTAGPTASSPQVSSRALLRENDIWSWFLV